jgi:hypothetical protein
MRTALQGFVATLLIGSMSGCAHYYNVGSIMKHGMVPEQGGTGFYDLQTRQIDASSPAFQSAYAAATRSVDDRNVLITRVMLISDDVCMTHKAEIEATANSVNLTFGALTTLFAGTATVIGAESTSKALSAAAAASNAGRSLVNEEVYKKAFSISILRAIDQQRDELRTPIMRGMSLPLDRYPIHTALLDLSRYHTSCAFISGLAAISESLEYRPASRATIESRIDLLREQMQKNDERRTTDASNAAVYNNSNAELQRQIDELARGLSQAPE